jgi:hypothetical protein
MLVLRTRFVRILCLVQLCQCRRFLYKPLYHHSGSCQSSLCGARDVPESRGGTNRYIVPELASATAKQTLACLSNWAHSLTQGSGESVLGMNVAKVRHITLSPTLAVLRPSEEPYLRQHALSRRPASSRVGRYGIIIVHGDTRRGTGDISNGADITSPANKERASLDRGP